MRGMGSLLGLILVLGIGYFVYKAQFTQTSGTVVSPKQQIDVVGVKSDLFAIAQAQRIYLTTHATYASMEQLLQEGSITFSGNNRRGYNYVATIVDGSHFRITATPADPSKAGWPILTIDETMQISQK